MSELDSVIHQPARLRIMASLAALRPEDQVEFTWLRKFLGLTDGNLGAHIQKLEDAGYIEVEKTFLDRRPKTFIAATDKGRAAFREHVKALQEIIGNVDGEGH